MGLGDSLYLQSVVRHLVAKGERIKVHSQWPDVFRPLGNMVEMAKFTRANVNILAHYSLRKGRTDTDQFQDCCIQAGIKEPVEMKLDWSVVNRALVDKVKSFSDKPIVIVQLPRSPMGRVDGFGKELLPNCSIIQKAIDRIKDRATIVQIGSGNALYKFAGIDIDLANKTTVCDLLDVASIADGFLGYCSFIVPLAESFDKPAFLVWSSRGLKAPHEYVRRITPQKILHKQTSKWVLDTDPIEKINGAIDAFLR